MVQSRAQLTFNVVETDAQLEKLMLLEVAKELNLRIPRRLSVIDDKMRVATLSFLRATDTYSSLVYGDLAAHFGIPANNREQRIDRILQAVVNRMEIDFVPISLRGRTYNGGLKFRVLLKNLSEVLTLSDGMVITEKGQTLEWLRWLLTLGDKIIISEYDVKLQPGRGRSRGGYMVPKDAGSWRVPPVFAGTLSDNWLTRAFNDNINSYLSIIEQIVKNELQRI